jgi:hypothetical protein
MARGERLRELQLEDGKSTGAWVVLWFSVRFLFLFASAGDVTLAVALQWVVLKVLRLEPANEQNVY